jgi:hypothetical protein
MKVRPVGAELSHVGGRTDRKAERHDEANSRFSQFCEGAKKVTMISRSCDQGIARPQVADGGTTSGYGG